MRRRLRTVLVAAPVLLAGCAANISGTDLQDEVLAALQDAGEQVDSISCPEGLPAELGASVACTAGVGGAARTVEVTVTGVDGSEVQYEVDLS